MLIGLIVLISLVLLIIGHELGHFFAAKGFKIDVPEFGLGFPPRIVAKKFGSTEYSVNWLPFGGFVRIRGENDHLDEEGAKAVAAVSEEEKKKSFAFQPAWKRSVVVLAGVAINFVIGWLLIAGVYMVGTPPLVAIDSVRPDSPAAAAGFQSGDILKGYDGIDQLLAAISDNKGKEMQFAVLRGADEVKVVATPLTNPEPGQGALGVTLTEGGAPRLNPIKALGVGFMDAARISWATVKGFAYLITTAFTKGSLPQDVVGPVGIFSIAKQAGEFGLIYLVQLMSIISLNLAVLNLIPFPALDGGRFILILVEKIKGSPVARRTEGIINAVGFVLLILLMVTVTFRDVVRLF